MNNVLIHLLGAVYTVYMLNWFKTTYNLAHPLSYFENPLLYHPVGKLDHPQNLVCPLGNSLSWVLAAYLVARGLALQFFPEEVAKFKHVNLILVGIAATLSLMNFNVLVYLLPVFALLILV
jgi:hypothetical protein